MTITYDNFITPSRLLTFSDVPNILKVKETIVGSKGVFSFIFSGNLQSSVSGDAQYHLTFLDETVTNVMSPSKAKNKRFYISSSPQSTAASFANALRNCPSLAAQFTIEHSDDEVELVARTIGKKWTNVANYLDTNIPSANLTTTAYDGTAEPSDVYGCKVQLEVFSEGNYLTQLEKNYYGDECAFDVSPILATLSEYGKVKPYRFSISTISTNGDYSYRGSVSGFTTVGYVANQSDKCKLMNNSSILLNTNRNQIRYVYGSSIQYSLIFGSSNTAEVTYSVKDSTLSEIYTASTTYQGSSYPNGIADTSFTIPNQYYTLASYVDLTIGTQSVRFKVIKPLKATEYYQRVLWRNEYGGIEFFDFTGQRTESDSVDIETYEKNIFDVYENPSYEIKKIYSNNVKKEVKLTTHLMEENGRWFVNSLMRSKKVWTTINGKLHYIILKAVEVTEDQNYNNIFTATITYEYSQLS